MKKTRCYIYTRVSTAIQVDGYSLDAQKDKLRNLMMPDSRSARRRRKRQ